MVLPCVLANETLLDRTVLFFKQMLHRSGQIWKKLDSMTTKTTVECFYTFSVF